jgi:hypothetical protein
MPAVGIMASAVHIEEGGDEVFPSIASTNTEFGTSLGTNNAMPPPPDVVAGDLIVAICLNDNPSTTDLAASTGYAQITTHTQPTNGNKMAAFGRVADGGANDALSLSGATQDYCVAITRITDHGVTDVAADIKFANGNSTSGGTSANPPSLDAGALRKWLWLGVAGIDTISGTIAWSAMPAGYTQTVTPLQSAHTASSCALGVAHNAVEIQTEDPGPFTIGYPAHWQSLTLAIPPAGAPSIVYAWQWDDPVASGDSGSFELGSNFTANDDIHISAIRVHGGNTNTYSERKVNVWEPNADFTSATLLTQIDLPDALNGDGAQDVACSIDVPAGARRAFSYQPGENWYRVPHGFDSARTTADGAVTFPAETGGRFSVVLHAYPNSSFDNTYYGIDFAYTVT